MTNSIRRLRVVTRGLSPVEAEILVLAEAEYVTPETELRGRLTGPTCPYATTVEVAYPLRPLPRPVPGLPPARRVVIPEPSLWDPVCPFLYQGAVELWQGGDMHQRLTLRHGLRSAVLRPDGLRWNGKRLKLRVAAGNDLSEAQLPALREAGVNALLAEWPDPALLAAAERLGFVMIARPASPEEEGVESAALLGWLLPPDWRGRTAEWAAWVGRQRVPVGAAFDGDPLPAGVQFLVGGPESPLPRLLTDAEGELGRFLSPLYPGFAGERGRRG